MIEQQLRALRKVIYRLEKWESPIGRGLFRVALGSYELYDSLVLRRHTRPDLASEKLVLPAARLLFVAVPKVATRSLIDALRGSDAARGGSQVLEADVESLLLRHAELRGYFKFTFVRNPWSRAVSCYREKLDPEHAATHAAIKQARMFHARPGLEVGMSFEAFAEWLNTPEGSDDVADRHWMSQHRVLAYGRPELITYDFIGRFEHLPQDYETLRARTGVALPALGHKLQTRAAEEYKSSYNARTIELIRRRYARDIECFGYDYDEGR